MVYLFIILIGIGSFLDAGYGWLEFFFIVIPIWWILQKVTEKE